MLTVKVHLFLSYCKHQNDTWKKTIDSLMVAIHTVHWQINVEITQMLDDLFCLQNLFLQFFSSINFDCSVDFTNEHISRIKTNSTSQKPECNDHQKRVTEVQKCWNELRYIQLCDEIKHCICKNIYSRSSRRDEGSPPPMIIFSTQLEIHHHNGDLGT